MTLGHQALAGISIRRVVATQVAVVAVCLVASLWWIGGAEAERMVKLAAANTMGSRVFGVIAILVVVNAWRWHVAHLRSELDVLHGKLRPLRSRGTIVPGRSTTDWCAMHCEPSRRRR